GRPLLEIAVHAGAEWEEHAREAVERVRIRTEAPLKLLLRDIRNILDQRAAGELLLTTDDGKHYIVDTDRIPSADLAHLLANLEGQPWCEWGRAGQPLTPNALARLLSETGVRPGLLHFRTAGQNGPGEPFSGRGY